MRERRVPEPRRYRGGDRLRQMSAYLRDDLGARLFDVAMLARELRDVIKSAFCGF